jgi:hypothetical protein
MGQRFTYAEAQKISQVAAGVGAAVYAKMLLDAAGALPPPASSKKEIVKRFRNWRTHFASMAMHEDGSRFDVNETAMFAQALEALQAKFVDKRYRAYKAKEFIPMSTGIPAGAETVAAIGFDGTGEATILASYGEDVPLVDTHARKMLTPVVGYAAAWRLTLQQSNASAMSGLPIDDKGLMTAKRVCSQKEDELLSVGDATLNIQGLLSVTGATTNNLTNGNWNAATAAQIIQDVHDAMADVRLATGQLFEPTHMIVPTDQYARIKELPRFADSGPTVLEWLEDKYDLTISKWWRCDAAHSPSGNDTLVLYSKDDEVVTGYAPILPEQLPPEYRSLYYLTVVHGRCGGVNSANAAAIRYAQNV